MPPHSVVLSFIGACLLWVGWFGFNAGSALSAGTLATSAFVATHFGAAAAADWLERGGVDAEWTVYGAGCDLGSGGGAGGDYAGFRLCNPDLRFVDRSDRREYVCYLMVVKVKSVFGYDDSLDAFGVHGAGGTIGALLTGIFASSAINPIFGAGKATGLLEGNKGQMLNQAIGVAIAWCLVHRGDADHPVCRG